jgi:hypothetical protein
MLRLLLAARPVDKIVEKMQAASGLPQTRRVDDMPVLPENHIRA